MPIRKMRRSVAPTPTGTGDLIEALAALITSIKPHALCDSCIALDVHVSHAEARDAALSPAIGEAFERALRRCHRCGRTVDVTAAR